MDLDAGASDFFSALEGGGDVFVDFGDLPAPDAPAPASSLDDEPLSLVRNGAER